MFNTCNTCWAEDAFMDNNDADREIFMVSNNMFPLWGVLLVIMDAADDDSDDDNSIILWDCPPGHGCC